MLVLEQGTVGVYVIKKIKKPDSFQVLLNNQAYHTIHGWLTLHDHKVTFAPSYFGETQDQWYPLGNYQFS